MNNTQRQQKTRKCFNLLEAGRLKLEAFLPNVAQASALGINVAQASVLEFNVAEASSFSVNSAIAAGGFHVFLFTHCLVQHAGTSSRPNNGLPAASVETPKINENNFQVALLKKTDINIKSFWVETGECKKLNSYRGHTSVSICIIISEQNIRHHRALGTSVCLFRWSLWSEWFRRNGMSFHPVSMSHQ